MQRSSSSNPGAQGPTGSEPLGEHRDEHHDAETLTDALLLASRAFVALATRSLSAVASDVTLHQYRALVLLGSRGPLTLAELAADLGVGPSTASRLVERMRRKDLLTRVADPVDRRQVHLAVRPAGAVLVDSVIRRRRAEIARIAAALTRTESETVLLVESLHRFAELVGEAANPDWAAGWATPAGGTPRAGAAAPPSGAGP
ncbi:MAG: MarR family winged helix-turn-helix transcriptional regulator [Actinomycetes bacterium]